MPFVKTPPQAVLEAFIADLKSKNIAVERTTLEADLDRIVASLHMGRSALIAMKEFADEPEVARRIEEQKASQVFLEMIMNVIGKHLAGYFE
jgi:hypothetical protein